MGRRPAYARSEEHKGELVSCPISQTAGLGLKPIGTIFIRMPSSQAALPPKGGLRGLLLLFQAMRVAVG